MKSVLRTSALFAALLFVVSAAQAANRVVKPLFAGQHILVGQLVVENDSRYLYVTYDMTKAPAGMSGFVPGWTMQTTHLFVGKSKPTSAAPGRFPFKHEGLNNVSVDTYKIKLSTLTEVRCLTTLYIAAHADTCETNAPGVGDCVADYAAVADQLSLVPTVTFGYGEADSYFSVDLGALGLLPGYCVDFYGAFPLIGSEYVASFVPSYLADGSLNASATALIGDYGRVQGNLDLLNYLVNQTYSVASGSDPNLLASATQLAFWYLANRIDPATLLPSTGYENVIGVTWEIINDALNNGEGFVPTCGQKMIVIADSQSLASTPEILRHDQHVGFLMVVPGKPTEPQCETAWAKGCTVFSTGWGSYFRYTVK